MFTFLRFYSIFFVTELVRDWTFTLGRAEVDRKTVILLFVFDK